MNNTRDIYNNILDNLVKFYGPRSTNIIGKPRTSTTGANDPFLYSIFTSSAYQGENWKNAKNAIIQQIMKGNNILMSIGSFINIEGITITTNGKQQTIIPIYVIFISSNDDISKFIHINTRTAIDTNMVNFVIGITTHKFEGSNINAVKENIRASDYFFHQFNYKEFSIDIFNHVYQPRYELIRNAASIKQITDKYLIDLSSMGSIFMNDPVNKRLLGLPKISMEGIQKDIPDIYRIFQDQGINYRKVIASGTHNPFTK